jgi:hypothetical protein
VSPNLYQELMDPFDLKDDGYGSVSCQLSIAIWLLSFCCNVPLMIFLGKKATRLN